MLFGVLASAKHRRPVLVVATPLVLFMQVASGAWFLQHQGYDWGVGAAAAGLVGLAEAVGFALAGRLVNPSRQARETRGGGW